MFVKKWNLGHILFISVHSLINSKSNELPQSLGRLYMQEYFLVFNWADFPKLNVDISDDNNYKTAEQDSGTYSRYFQ